MIARIQGVFPKFNLRGLIGHSILMAVIIFCLLALLATLWRLWLNDPPIQLISQEPKDIGILCPGDESPIKLFVIINDDIIMHYYVTVMDELGNKNVLGTQKAFTDLQHPHPVRIMIDLPWEVPELPAGKHLRVTGARNVAGTQNTVRVETLFTVGDTCP